ncbi:MAG TPA: LytTR family DNA-binding domain-containing protein [Longimicrobium sp.]|nr:LytTR family DNA-binding domain-containing protein [Longimicrobium sp.]
MEALRTIIVDDEPLARERLRMLLAGVEGVEVVAECADGMEAVETIRRMEPDVVFLDVQMPGLDGFDVVERLGDDIPIIVFCTAYDEYALRAFDANAVDYLLKPIDTPRLSEAVTRARRRADADRTTRLPAAMHELLAAMGRAPERPSRLSVREGERFVVVRVDEIIWIEAADNYVLLHLPDAVHRYRATMAEIEALLQPQRFLRIHRSIILNVDQVKVIESWGLGEYLFVLSNGRKLASSRRYRQPIRDTFGC